MQDSRSNALAQFSAFPDDSPDAGDDDGRSVDAIYLTTKAGLEAGNQISVDIRAVTLKAHGDPPDKDNTAGVVSSGFTVQVSSPLAEPTENDDMGGVLTNLGSQPSLRITSPHGSGKMAVYSTEQAQALSLAGKEETLGNLEFTYTADGGGMATGAKVEITIPDAFAAVPFEPASNDDNRSGAVVLRGPAELEVNDRVLTATLSDHLDHGSALVFVYKGVKAPAAEGSYTFKARASSGPHGALADLGADEQKAVDVTGAHGAGTVSLTRGGSTFRQASKEQQLGNLTFTYTAAGRMATGAMVQITIPDGWTSAHLDNGDGTASPGEVALSGKADLEVTGGGATPWKLKAKANAALVSGDRLVFTYKSVQAPAAAGSYTFETSAIAFEGALNIDDAGARLDSSPTVGIDQAPDGSGTLSVSKSSTPALTKDAAG